MRKRTAASQKQSNNGVLYRILQAIGSFLLFLLALVWKGVTYSKTTKIVSALLALAVIAGGVDALVNKDKVFDGVTVDGIELGGQTLEEAKATLDAHFSSALGNNTAVFFIDEATQQNAGNTLSESLEEQLSYEESLELRTQWTVPTSQVEATLDTATLAKQAFETGRSDGGLFVRLACLFTGVDVPASCLFNEQLFEELRQSMTASAGKPRVNYGVEMVNGQAVVTDGHAGREVDARWLAERLSEAYLSNQSRTTFLLEITDAPLQITQAQAQQTADHINASVQYGAQFTYKDASWTASREDMSNWIKTRVVSQGDTYTLEPYLDEDITRASLSEDARAHYSLENIQVSMLKNEDASISLSTNAQGEIPEVNQTIADLNERLFDTDERSEAPQFAIATQQVPASMSLEEALMVGVVSEVASYTTQYASGATARNHNIRLASDYLTNSIVKANGGIWSFNEIAGDSTVEKGYQDAGVIIDNQYTDAIGGGICQVATTIFNAVYDAGYPVEERYNHSLYIASYPDGRDAAIAYPYLDLVWKNDTQSDVLLVMSYTETSVTCTLYGVNPHYQVSTTVGEWAAGDEFETTYVDDETLPSGQEVVEIKGENGRSISVIRTVADTQGNLLHEDVFRSVYQPKDEVIRRGVGTPETTTS